MSKIKITSLFICYLKFKKMSKIKELDKFSINRICSGQVIIDLKTSIKELIENSIVYI